MRRVSRESRRQIADAFGEVLRARAVAVDRGIRGPWRQPDIEVVWGEGTETVHVEAGIRFKLDVARVMFSSGNLAERMRMGRIAQRGEIVVDLFAGIGQFALPMAVHSRPARLIACEMNPEAYAYLEENVRLNRAWSVEPRLGDCRQTAPEGVADRVVMGYLHGESYLDIAMRAAKDACVLHYHENVPIEDADRASRHVLESAAKAGFHASILAVHRIKSYAPRIRHLVVDARLTR
jgi:tRNA wybutosine-synthesizing protein 2